MDFRQSDADVLISQVQKRDYLKPPPPRRGYTFWTHPPKGVREASGMMDKMGYTVVQKAIMHRYLASHFQKEEAANTLQGMVRRWSFSRKIKRRDPYMRARRRNRDAVAEHIRRNAYKYK